MKILHIIDSGGMYGAEVMLLNLMREQVRLGLTPTLASIGDRGKAQKPIEREAAKLGLRVRAFHMRLGLDLRGTFEILRFASESGCHLLHTHGYKGDILFGWLPRQIRRLPLVTTVHGWTSTGGLTKLALYEWLDGKSLRFMDAVAVVSESMRAHLRLKSLDPYKVHVVPNGISCVNSPDSPGEVPASEALSTTGLDPAVVEFCVRGFTIGSIGRLSPEKGQDVLLDACELLLRQGLDVRLVIIGDGPERCALETRVRGSCDLRNRVLLTGYREDAKRYLPLFGTFVIPSLTEGLPITLLEALSLSVPVVSTRVGGIPAVLRHGELGVLVNPSEPEELARGIAWVMENSELQSRMSAEGKALVEQCYSAASMAKSYQAIYSAVISAGARQTGGVSRVDC